MPPKKKTSRFFITMEIIPLCRYTSCLVNASIPFTVVLMSLCPRSGNPVRSKYPHGSSKQLAIAGDSLMEAEGQWENPKEDCEEQQEEVNKCAKRLLPDRTQAAHNRANEKLVHFVIKQRMVEGRLLV